MNVPGRSMHFAGIRFDAAGLDEVVAWLMQRRREDRFAYVVTPNADHVVRLHENPGWTELQDAYREADLCLCDSRVLSLLARLKGKTLSAVPGSDLVGALLGHKQVGASRLLLVGGSAETAMLLGALLPDAEILQHVPPMDLLAKPQAIQECADFVLHNPHDFTLLAVGSPQQEVIARRIAKVPGAQGTALCIGAAVDFLTGKTPRAPRWMRVLALEWLHRLLSDPQRLWRRYLLRSPRVLWLALVR